ncbi:hypothetical protein [Planctomicrobium piriforme]|uniref:Uncharacterized protein n=1 Tax=Planctomicrobium piriforme TaxID=1576369 RepID=A0A1I3GVA7_9PLAN|nr:hypothetical protein [Planctomicrobium piriforme]SFI27300.1 hypothetical protein SAMN05421753_107140 [Planctomicrobium piriforme]
MTQQTNENRFHLGFLRVALTDQGYVGGLLVTNHLGRPLEFQCTTPVRANRTQQILYGPTLEPFIYAELIGKTLFERLGVKPQLIIVAQENLLDLRRQVDVPVISLIENAGQKELPDQLRVSLGCQTFKLHAEFGEDLERLNAMQKRIPAEADMLEPLERVNDALKETLRAGAVA